MTKQTAIHLFPPHPPPHESSRRRSVVELVALFDAIDAGRVSGEQSHSPEEGGALHDDGDHENDNDNGSADGHEPETIRGVDTTQEKDVAALHVSEENVFVHDAVLMEAAGADESAQIHPAEDTRWYWWLMMPLLALLALMRHAAMLVMSERCEDAEQEAAAVAATTMGEDDDATLRVVIRWIVNLVEANNRAVETESTFQDAQHFLMDSHRQRMDAHSHLETLRGQLHLIRVAGSARAERIYARLVEIVSDTGGSAASAGIDTGTDNTTCSIICSGCLAHHLLATVDEEADGGWV